MARSGRERLIPGASRGLRDAEIAMSNALHELGRPMASA